MHCPECKQEMEEYSKDISSDPKTEKEYNRTYYYCKQDDVYILVEIPVIKKKHIA